MAFFTEWLLARSEKGDAAQARLDKLVKFVGSNPSWPTARIEAVPYLKVIANNGGADSDELTNIFLDYFGAWKQGQEGGPKTDWSGHVANLGAPLLIVFAIVVAIVLGFGIFFGHLLSDVAKPDHARGLITFLFAFSTIAIVIMVVVATFWISKDEIEERLDNAKDIITIMIGVLGTVIGFYFGSQDDTNRNSMVASAVASPATVRPGETFTIAASIGGGTPPYTYSIVFPLGGLKIDVADTSSDDGNISRSIKVPATAKGPIALPFTLRVKDNASKETTATGATLVDGAPVAAPAQQ
jgi:hypothetical protein